MVFDPNPTALAIELGGATGFAIGTLGIFKSVCPAMVGANYIVGMAHQRPVGDESLLQIRFPLGLVPRSAPLDIPP